VGRVLGKSVVVVVLGLVVLVPSAMAAPTVSSPQVTSVSPDFAYAGTTKNVVVHGSGFQPGATLSMGPGITVTSLTFVNSTRLAAAISVGSSATHQPRSPAVTNPDGGTGSCDQCFLVPPAGVRGTIAFDRRDEASSCTGNVENIYKMSTHGGGVTELTFSPGGTLNIGPVFSPDGTMIAFTKEGGCFTGPQIELMKADGSNQAAIPGTRGDGASGWSPDGTKLLFNGANQTIGVMNVDGSGQQQLTTPPSGDLDSGGRFSPDGTRIAFDRFSTAKATVAVDEINADGSGLTQVASENQFGGGPSWSPNGTKIAFVCGAPSAVCTMNPDGSDVTQLFRSSLNGVSSITWSPDGTRIAFVRPHSTRAGILSDVYEMKADGSDLAQITFDGDVSGGLSWTP
jgi:Tol biopolymer transport system component